MTKTIVTHINPDFDAITYVWLLRRFAPGFERAYIEFMPLNNLDHAALSQADSVGDMGGLYDPDQMRFDHHHLPGAQSTATCATMQTWKWLLSQGAELQYLCPLIEEIHRGDLAQSPPVGIHSQMFGWKSAAKEAGRILSDHDIYAYGAHILNQIELWLKRKADNQAELEEKVVWKSRDNSVWAIRGGSVGVSFAAYDEGARVVVFEGEPIELDEGASYPVGATRAPEWHSPHLGDIIFNLVQDDATRPGIKKELSTWFRHNGGFYSGRGGAKAPDSSPLEVDIIEIAKSIHLMWER